MLKQLARAPVYVLFRFLGWPRVLPMNLTISVTFRCNSLCRTCNIYKREAQELSLEEWQKVFKNIGKSCVWSTFSGGEPFLRPDLSDLVASFYDNCKPAIICIPTNGLLPDRIIPTIKKIIEHCRESQIIVNLSIDEVGSRHDLIRGVPGNYEKAIMTYKRLREIRSPNFAVGIHTVISNFNVQRIPAIYENMMALQPDSYITEIAEERAELGTMGIGITPNNGDYSRAANYLIRKLKSERFRGIGQITRAFRLRYYELAQRILKENRQVIPCYAGFASAQISADGNIWNCCIRAESIGNLRDAEYEFSRLWNSGQAIKLRKSIKQQECCCPLANSSYTNMLLSPLTLIRVIWNLASQYFRSLHRRSSNSGEWIDTTDRKSHLVDRNLADDNNDESRLPA